MKVDELAMAESNKSNNDVAHIGDVTLSNSLRGSDICNIDEERGPLLSAHKHKTASFGQELDTPQDNAAHKHKTVSFGQELDTPQDNAAPFDRDTATSTITTSTRPGLRSAVSSRFESNQRPSQLKNHFEFLEESFNEEGITIPKSYWWHGVFFFSFIALIACVLTLYLPYPYGARMGSEEVAEMPWSDGCQDCDSCICPRETICADSRMTMAFLTIARCSAWFDYPLYMILFLSKAHNLNNFLQSRTMLRVWINFSDYHKVHRLFGIIVGIETCSHSFFHILRWAYRKDDIQLLWTTSTGITGLIALISGPFIILPMVVPYLKKTMAFELRKGLHYLSLVWAGVIMHHAPQRIFWLIGVPFFIYLADKLVGVTLKTHLLENAYFERLSDSTCLITFENPTGFGKQNATYTYLVLPWISKFQFHAFTVFPSLDKPDHSCICISKSGWFTSELMKQVKTPTHRTAYVVGPYLSPFSSPAMDCNNLIAVASGIGVTPALSLIKRYAEQTLRRISLVWICRDPGLVEHFIQSIGFGDYGYALIYYTGRGRQIVLEDDLPPNVFLFTGRPNLAQTLSGIIYSIVSGDWLPEELCEDHTVIAQASPEVRCKLVIDKALSLYSVDTLFEYAFEATCDIQVSALPASAQKRESQNPHRFKIPSQNNRHSTIGRVGGRASTLGMGGRASTLGMGGRASTLGKKMARFNQRTSAIVGNHTFSRATVQDMKIDFSQLEEGDKSEDDDTVDIQGLTETMKRLLGEEDYKFVEEKLAEHFQTLSTDGKLDVEQFGELMGLMVGGVDISDHQLERVKKSTERQATRMLKVDEFQIVEELKGEDSEFAATNWSMLYCGGSQPVVDQLKDYRDKFGIGLSIEKFDW